MEKVFYFVKKRGPNSKTWTNYSIPYNTEKEARHHMERMEKEWVGDFKISTTEADEAQMILRTGDTVQPVVIMTARHHLELTLLCTERLGRYMLGKRPVLGRIVGVGVHAQHDGDVGVGGGSADDDALGAGVEVLRSSLAVGEVAGRLDRDRGAELLPSELAGIALGRDRDLPAIDHDRVARGLDLAWIVSVDRVVLEEVSQGAGIRQIVDADDVEIHALRGAEDETPDAAEAVDSDPNGHFPQPP